MNAASFGESQMLAQAASAAGRQRRGEAGRGHSLSHTGFSQAAAPGLRDGRGGRGGLARSETMLLQQHQRNQHRSRGHKNVMELQKKLVQGQTQQLPEKKRARKPFMA